jgi:hypothetical protein
MALIRPRCRSDSHCSSNRTGSIKQADVVTPPAVATLPTPAAETAAARRTPTNTAASMLTALAVAGQAIQQAQTAAPLDSRPQHAITLPPVSRSRPQSAKSKQKPAPAGPTYVIEPATRPLDLPRANSLAFEYELRDLPPGDTGQMNRQMSQLLNGAQLEFFLFGGEGRGRCLLSAFFNSYDMRFHIGSDSNFTSAERLKRYDELRSNFKLIMEQLDIRSRRAS